MIQLINTNGTGFTVEYLNGLVQTLLDTFGGLRSQCVSGLTMEVDTGLDLIINTGSFISTQLVAVTDAITVTLADDSDQYVWIDLDQAVTFTDTFAEVTDDRVCLGKVTTVSGSITKVRYDRRMQAAAGPWDSETTKAVTTGTYVLTPTEFSRPSIVLTGTLSGVVNLIVPEWPGFTWTFNNQTNNAYAVKVIDYQANELTLGTGVTQVNMQEAGPTEPGV